MKHLNLFFCLFFSLFCIPAYSTDTSPILPIPPLPVPHALCLNETTLPLTLSVSNSELAICLNNSIGIATIILTDDAGEIVYQETVDTDATLDFNIPIDWLDAGKYI